MILLAKYLLVGVITGCLIEAVVRFRGWPVMVIVFIYNFIKGFLNKN